MLSYRKCVAFAAALAVSLLPVLAVAAPAHADGGAQWPPGCTTNGDQFIMGGHNQYPTFCWNGQNPSSYNTGGWYVGAAQTIMQRYSSPQQFVGVDCQFGPQTQAATWTYQGQINDTSGGPAGVWDSYEWSYGQNELPGTVRVWQNIDGGLQYVDYYGINSPGYDNNIYRFRFLEGRNQWQEWGTWYNQTSYANLTATTGFSCSLP